MRSALPPSPRRRPQPRLPHVRLPKQLPLRLLLPQPRRLPQRLPLPNKAGSRSDKQQIVPHADDLLFFLYFYPPKQPFSP